MEIHCRNTFSRKSDLFISNPGYSVRMLDEWVAIASFVLLKSFSSNGICGTDHFFSALVITGIKFIKAVHKRSFIRLLLVVWECVDSKCLRTYAGLEIVVLPLFRSDWSRNRHDLIRILDCILCNVVV